MNVEVERKGDCMGFHTSKDTEMNEIAWETEYQPDGGANAQALLTPNGSECQALGWEFDQISIC